MMICVSVAQSLEAWQHEYMFLCLDKLGPHHVSFGDYYEVKDVIMGNPVDPASPQRKAVSLPGKKEQKL